MWKDEDAFPQQPMTEYELTCPHCWTADETVEGYDLAERKMIVHHEDTGHKMNAEVA